MHNPNGLPDRILILGDESKSSRAIERLLNASGYGAVVLDSFELAREHMRVQEVSLIIIEPSSSRISGPVTHSPDSDSGGSVRRHQWAQQALRFCEEIRLDKATTEIPILVISKSQRPQDKVACLNRGATDYISKPCQRAELLSRVNAHLRLSRYERERAEKFEQLNVLHAVASVLSSSLEPELILRGTLTVLLNHLRAEAGAVFLREADGQAMSLFAAEGFNELEDKDNALLDLYSRIAPLMNGEPMVLDPLPESARRGLAGEILQDVHSLVCAPLGLKDNRAGAICLFSTRTTAFASNQAELIATISYQLSVALENARLYVEAKKSASQLSFVYNLGNNLMTSLEMDELLGYAVFTVGKSLDCDACAVVVRTSSESDNLASAIYSRQHNQAHNDNWFHAERITRCLQSADGLQPAIQIRVAEKFLRDPLVAIETTVPLMFDDRVLGVLICGNYSAHPISADDQKLLGAVAQQLSLAIRNTELYQRTKDTSINLAVEVSKRTREAEEQKRFTEKIIDSLPVSLYVVDQNMRIVAWNRNREVGGRGINREEVLGRNVFHVLTRQPRRKLEEEFIDVFRTGDLVRMEQESWYEGQRKIWKI
ncbi:MAG TPA: GAF domain-containing protein, partial [Pyrinomonadaceae bacterium]|nr:GAF domain-containing protein [Pyrinomonadaceae bacterium]